MARNKIETIRNCIRFGCFYQCDGEWIDRWSLVDDFFTAINQYREMFVTTSDVICMDESMLRWYALGGRRSSRVVCRFGSIESLFEGLKWFTITTHCTKMVSKLSIKVGDSNTVLNHISGYSEATSSSLRHTDLHQYMRVVSRSALM